jgi:SAM-dependent methyltransferase
MAREPRLVFGEVAELYDRVRPTYPAALVDDVVELAGVGRHVGRGRVAEVSAGHAVDVGGGPALEVGAGTAKATVLFARRGVSIHALEPSAAMAAIARRKCAELAGITIEETDFERWNPRGQRFALIFCAQAWHWVAPDLRYRRARAALQDGGLLAVFWSRPSWDRCALGDELRALYARTAADFGPDPGPMHPGSEIAPDRWEDWDAEIAAADGLEQPEVRFYDWSDVYTTERYQALLSTTQDHILLADQTRATLLAEIGEAIDRHGGSFEMHYVTKLCLAHATVLGDRAQTSR